MNTEMKGSHTSLYRPSATYQAWKAKTNHIESVTLLHPPRRVACSQTMLMLTRTQRINPGLSSLKDLMSKEPMDGFNSRPINHLRMEMRRNISPDVKKHRRRKLCFQNCRPKPRAFLPETK